MADSVLYADLNLPELTRPRILRVPDVQDSGCTYAEVKVKSQDTNAAANCKSSGKSCCSRKRVALWVVIMLVLVLAVCLIITYGSAAGTQNSTTAVNSSSQNDSNPLSPPNQEDSRTLSPTKQKDSTTLSPTSQQGYTKVTCNSQNVSTPLSPTSQNDSTPLSPTSQENSTKLPPIHGEAPGCPPPWIKHERKCYFFSPVGKKEDWNSSRAECAAMGSDLVIIENREELDFLLSQSNGSYYFLGLRYYPEEQKWKWINNVEYDPARFSIKGNFRDYHCTAIGHGEVHSASCKGDNTSQNLCEKAATMLKNHQKKS